MEWVLYHNYDGNGKKMGIVATSDGVHTVTAMENKNVDLFFSVAVAMWANLHERLPGRCTIAAGVSLLKIE